MYEIDNKLFGSDSHHEKIKFALLIHWTDKKSYLWNTVTLQKIFGVNILYQDVIKNAIERMQHKNKTHLKSISGLHALAVKPMLGITKVDSLTPSTLNPQAAEFMSAMMPIFQAVDVLLSVLDASAQRNTVATNPQRVNLFELDERKRTIELSPDQTRFKENEALQAYTAGFKSMFKNTHPKSRMLANVNQAAAGMRLVILFVGGSVSPFFYSNNLRQGCAECTVETLKIYFRKYANVLIWLTAGLKNLAEDRKAQNIIASEDDVAELAQILHPRRFIRAAEIAWPSVSQLIGFWDALGNGRYSVAAYQESEIKMWTAILSVACMLLLQSKQHAPYLTVFKSYFSPPMISPFSVSLMMESLVQPLDSRRRWSPPGPLPPASLSRPPKRTGKKSSAPPSTGPVLRDRTVLAAKSAAPMVNISVASSPKKRKATSRKARATPDLEEEEEWCKHEPEIVDLVGDDARLQEQYEGKLKVDLDSERKRSEEGFTFKIYDAVRTPGQIPKEEEFTMFGFENSWEHNKRLMSEIVAGATLCIESWTVLTEIQDVGLRTLEERQISRVGLFSDLLRPVEKDGHQRTLNALSNVLPNKSMELPPAWSVLAMHEQAFTVLYGSSGVSQDPIPKHIHSGLCFAQRILPPPAFEVLFGTKIVALAYRKRGLPETDLRGDWRSRHAFDGWDGAFSNTDYYEYEIFRFVLDKFFAVIMSNVIHDDAVTNASHAGARWIFLRIFRFQVRRICGGRSGSLHVPDLLTKEGCLDLLYLHHFIVLYLVFHPWSYLTEALENVESNMSDTHWTELCGTQALSVELEKYILANFQFQYTAPSNSAQRFRSFLDVLQYSLTHLAITLSIAKSELWDDENPGSFTPEEFDEQLTAATATVRFAAKIRLLLCRRIPGCSRTHSRRGDFSGVVVTLDALVRGIYSLGSDSETEEAKGRDQERPSDADRVPKKKR
ncbi:hypothetical protein C8J57DRAFT_1250112 [Mycena rebaudengoi]|nr:hypothetical protein C8J57DRAFT_1250112 [Mycena rebaudengoi]